ncbi:MAG: hypothetical protein ACYSWX_08850 [Planctomycetota bacterium]
MKRSYEFEDARRLQPLLTSIQCEIDERSVAIQRCTRAVTRLRDEGIEDLTVSNLVAELANHRRELRLALEELEHFGCVADPGVHTEIFIPGPDGSLEEGFHLDAQGNLSGASEIAGA